MTRQVYHLANKDPFLGEDCLTAPWAPAGGMGLSLGLGLGVGLSLVWVCVLVWVLLWVWV